MPHFRKLFDERFVGTWDLEGNDELVATIDGISMEEMRAC